jgi:hypothetical protein
MYLQCASASASAETSDAHSAESLRAHYAAMMEQLQHNQFHQPLVLDSSESSGALTGSIYARLSHPFAVVDAALRDPKDWCDVLILNVNTKYCHVSTSNAGTVLTLNIGKKTPQRLEDTYRLDFTYRVAAAADDYFQVQLDADKGPLSTRDYRILMEAVALDDGETFLHLTYSYAYGFAGRLAMNTYLSTTGRGKVGFTIVGTQPDGQPEYIRRMRGLVERSTMRYYLAIEAYLGAVGAPPAEQLEQRLENWFSATELYPRQLHEVDRAAYLDMKRSEYQRQQTMGMP